MDITAELVVAVIIGLLSVARTARLVGFDEYPPMAWLRDRWDEKFGEEGWGKLIHCPFCSAPYMTAVMLVWMYLALPGSEWSDVGSSAWWWTVVNGVWGLSYLSSIVVAYDQPE